jgi:hypothetical protein
MALTTSSSVQPASAKVALIVSQAMRVCSSIELVVIGTSPTRGATPVRIMKSPLAPPSIPTTFGRD